MGAPETSMPATCFLGTHAQIHLVMFAGDAHRRQDGDIDHKGFVGELAGFMDGVSKFILGFKIGRRQVAHAPGIGYGGAKLGLGDPHHRPADDGIFDSEHFSNFRLNHLGPPYSMLDVQCSMFDVHFLVNPLIWELHCQSFFCDQTGHFSGFSG